MVIKKDTKIRDLLIDYPQTIECLLDYGLSCAGCPMSQLETIEEAASVHNINLEDLLNDLNRIIKSEGEDK